MWHKESNVLKTLLSEALAVSLPVLVPPPPPHLNLDPLQAADYRHVVDEDGLWYDKLNIFAIFC